MTEGYPIFQVFLARAVARKSKPACSSGSPRFFFSFFFPFFLLFLRVARSRQSPLERNHIEVGHGLFSVLRRVEKSSSNEEASILEGSLMKDRRVDPGFEGVSASSSSPLSTDDIVISMISRLEVA